MHTCNMHAEACGTLLSSSWRAGAHSLTMALTEAQGTLAAIPMIGAATTVRLLMCEAQGPADLVREAHNFRGVLVVAVVKHLMA